MAIAHVTLATADVIATSRFFQEAFGWQPIERPGNIPTAAAWLRIDTGQELHLVEVAGFQSSDFEDEFGRHIALSYPTAKFSDLKHRLVQCGAQLIEPKRDTDFERFFFQGSQRICV